MKSYRYPDGVLIQFAKNPVVGQVKTRLSPLLNDNECLTLHRQLVAYSYQQLMLSSLASVQLWHSSPLDQQSSRFFSGLTSNKALFLQQGQDLGMKMFNAFKQVLSTNSPYKMAVMVGSDCPFITKEMLSQAFQALANGHDAVVGPANDGGYYLIGLRKLLPQLFDNVSWGTSTVMAETRQRLAKSGASCFELETLSDIDRPEDLALLKALPAFF